MVGSSGEEEKTTSIAIIAIVAALALFGVVAITAVMTTIQLQEAEARPSTAIKSCDLGGGAFNALVLCGVVLVKIYLCIATAPVDFDLLYLTTVAAHYSPSP